MGKPAPHLSSKSEIEVFQFTLTKCLTLCEHRLKEASVNSSYSSQSDTNANRRYTSTAGGDETTTWWRHDTGEDNSIEGKPVEITVILSY